MRVSALFSQLPAQLAVPVSWSRRDFSGEVTTDAVIALVTLRRLPSEALGAKAPPALTGVNGKGSGALSDCDALLSGDAGSPLAGALPLPASDSLP